MWLIERFRKLRRLTPGESVVLAQAWGLFLLVELALRVVSFQRLLALCQVPRVPRRSGPTRRTPSVERLAWLVDVAGGYAPFKATCLKKTLVLSWLLRRRGIATVLRIGVAREGDEMRAHAWLDHEARPLPGDPEIAGYRPLNAVGAMRDTR